MFHPIRPRSIPGRRHRALAAVATASLLGILAACGDDTESVDTSDPIAVSVGQLVEDPERYDREPVITEGTVKTVIDDPPGAFVLDTGDTLVIAPMKPNDLEPGDAVEIEGTFAEYEFADPGALDAGEAGQPLADFDGEFAVFAGEVTVAE